MYILRMAFSMKFCDCQATLIGTFSTYTCSFSDEDVIIQPCDLFSRQNKGQMILPALFVMSKVSKQIIMLRPS